MLRRAAVQLLRNRAVLGRGISTVGQVGSAAAEMLRARRDPAAVARRRHLAAKRRLLVWGIGVLLGTAASVAVWLSISGSGLTAGHGVELVLAVALLVWCGAGAVRAIRDLRSRGRVVAALPPPAPARRAVSAVVQAEVDRLGDYSDTLRELVTMIGTTGTSDDRMILRVRRDVLRSADEVEERIRRQADELTGLQRAWRTAPPAAKEELTTAAAALTTQVKASVAEYGQLVAAASEAVTATGVLRGDTGGSLTDATDRLRALAAGMRELSGSGR